MELRIVLNLILGVILIPGLVAQSSNAPASSAESKPAQAVQNSSAPASPVEAKQPNPDSIASGKNPPDISLPPEFVNQPRFSERNPRYQIRANDVIDLTFAFAPEFNQTVTVQPDGFVALREVGDVHVQGMTVPQLTTTLRDTYAKILADPVIGVVLKDFEKPYFTAGGQVQKPGRYDMRGSTTLTDALMMAGGFNDAAKHSDVLLYRRASNDLVYVKSFNVKKLLTAGTHSEDVFLQPGDMVYVPKSASGKIREWVRVTIGIRPTTW
jgi:polysaccharide export outer membrane protein